MDILISGDEYCECWGRIELFFIWFQLEVFICPAKKFPKI